MWISFDLWDTLIKGNPVSKGARSEYFFERYNPLNKPKEVIEIIVKSVDIAYSDRQEISGVAISPYHYIYNTLEGLSNNMRQFDYKKIASIYEDICWHLYHDTSPLLFDENTIGCLEILSGKYDLYLHCNTGFTGGVWTDELVRRLGIAYCIKVRRYSDIQGYAKPHPSFKHSLCKGRGLHVGDRIYADGEFARNIGADFFHINSTSGNTITDLLEFVQSHE